MRIAPRRDHLALYRTDMQCERRSCPLVRDAERGWKARTARLQSGCALVRFALTFAQKRGEPPVPHIRPMAGRMWATSLL